MTQSPALIGSLVATAPPLALLDRAALSYIRREGPGWGKVYDLIGGRNDSNWAQHGMRCVRGKLHGYAMALDLGNWSERLSWFLARYHDRPIQDVVAALLQPGDAFVDVGANIGMLTLLAARCVGDGGQVLACEPNPRLVARIEAALRQNRIGNVAVQRVALAAEAGSRSLFEFDGHSGWGSLIADGPAGSAPTSSCNVRCQRGDDVLAAIDADRPTVLKIDVEGFEVPVLRGLRATLERRRPAVFVELLDEHQRRAGFSAAELRGELERHGYRGFALVQQRSWTRRYATRLRPLRADESHELDVLFVPPAGPMAARAAQLLQRLQVAG